MSNDPIILYDIPSKAPGCAWSPNTWKIRYALNYKGLAYRTIWIEYPDIVDLCKRIGAEPSMLFKDGSPYYSLPVIQDPKTGQVISDSARIADYLDATYPDTPELIPAGTHVLQRAFRVACDNATEPLWQYIIPAVAKILRPKSEEYYVRTREEDYGQKLTDVWPASEAHAKTWKEVEEGFFGKVDRWLNEPMNQGKPFVMGDVVSFADFTIAGKLQWCLKGFGEESDLWKDIMIWHGGRWARLIESLRKYEGPLEYIND
ncbi:glutathione S-transferase [Mycena galopus ATCC 62051]|nr:glutathione S-transferase [Mycena galopus ATCC 62051]